MLTDEPIPSRCGNCRWWVPGGPTLAKATRDPSAYVGTGTCQLMPPTIHVVMGAAASYFPVTHADRFCAEWEEPVDDTDGDGGAEAEPGADNVVALKAAA